MHLVSQAFHSLTADMGTLLVVEDLDEMNIEILRNTLYKAYLDDFAAFCNKLGGATAEVMGDLLAFEVQPLPLYLFVAPDTISCPWSSLQHS